ncbi:MAG: nitrilase-related carbon-nitrogen hydrolase [Planctomycetota bacterium]|nr:nitrilase-related carbon-nitrogen hydrolase [Planctomycetota bacterium]
MKRVTRAALIQTRCELSGERSCDELRRHMIDKTVVLIDKAAAAGAKVCCLQELFNGPYFAAEQALRWYDMGEPIDGAEGPGPTIRLMQSLAKKHEMVLIAPICERVMSGVYYNTAAVIGHTGELLGKYRKNHLPQCLPGFWEKFYFQPGDLGYPVFDTPFGRIGVYLCYDRHFPEGARELGMNGAEIVFNPSATVAGLSEYLWKLEQPAHAVANGYFVGAINRVGTEAPWNIGEFYGQSYFCNPRGQILVQASRDKDEVVVADLDLSMIEEVRRVWQFYRDRRPETYTRSREVLRAGGHATVGGTCG